MSISCVNQSHETNFRMVILKVLALGAVDGFGAGCTWAAWVRKICHAWIGKSPFCTGISAGYITEISIYYFPATSTDESFLSRFVFQLFWPIRPLPWVATAAPATPSISRDFLVVGKSVLVKNLGPGFV